MVGANKSIPGAQEYLPRRISLKSLHDAAQHCQGCPLFQNATQAVFGEGQRGAPIMFVGEQPGDEEDRRGRPFVGPAGRILDQALNAAGIRRDNVYVTNAVKHFKWEPQGKRRLHKKQSSREAAACRPWLEHEIELIEPQILVCMGASAAQAIFGRAFKLTAQRGQIIASALAPQCLATVHPAFIIRQTSHDDRRRAMDEFVADLKTAAGVANR